MAISIVNGIIMLIETDGQLSYYRQRGISTLSDSEIANEIKCGRLDGRWKDVQELPRNYSIYYEDEEIMGRATATYELVLRKKREMRKKSVSTSQNKRKKNR